MFETMEVEVALYTALKKRAYRYATVNKQIQEYVGGTGGLGGVQELYACLDSRGRARAAKKKAKYPPFTIPELVD